MLARVEVLDQLTNLLLLHEKQVLRRTFCLAGEFPEVGIFSRQGILARARWWRDRQGRGGSQGQQCSDPNPITLHDESPVVNYGSMARDLGERAPVATRPWAARGQRGDPIRGADCEAGGRAADRRRNTPPRAQTK